MGATLAKQVYATWSDLPRSSHSLLVFMALTVMDSDARPTFYAGRDTLAHALGLHPSKSTRRAVRRHLQTLISAGAITRTVEGHNGQRAEYRLHLNRGRRVEPTPLRPQSARGKEGRDDPPVGGLKLAERRVESGTEGGLFQPPQGTSEEQLRNKGEDQSAELRTQPQTARDPSRSPISHLDRARQQLDHEQTTSDPAAIA